MKIIAKKLKFNKDKFLKKSIKTGLQELINDYTNEKIVTIKGDKNTLTFITKDNYSINHIRTVLNNYSIPYKID